MWWLGMPLLYICRLLLSFLQSGQANKSTRTSQLVKLTSKQTTDKMIKFAVRKPLDNHESITTTGLRALGLEPLATGMVRAVVEDTGV